MAADVASAAGDENVHLLRPVLNSQLTKPLRASVGAPEAYIKQLALFSYGDASPTFGFDRVFALLVSFPVAKSFECQAGQFSRRKPKSLQSYRRFSIVAGST